MADRLGGRRGLGRARKALSLSIFYRAYHTVASTSAKMSSWGLDE